MTASNTNDVQPTLSLSAKIEALLFVAPNPVTISQLATVLDVTDRQVEKTLDLMQEEYTTRGIRLQMHRGRLQLTSAPETSELIEYFLGLESTSRLTTAALEALSIVAYQQPVTRPQIDSFRGVNSDGVLKTLLSKGLIQEVGRASGPGRPILYSTTPEFLGHFGLTSLAELPPLIIEEAPVTESDEDIPLLKE